MTELSTIETLVQKLRDLKFSQPSLASSDRSARPVSFESSVPIYLSAQERDALLKQLSLTSS
jgi:hypothetical protein